MTEHDDNPQDGPLDLLSATERAAATNRGLPHVHVIINPWKQQGLTPYALMSGVFGTVAFSMQIDQLPGVVVCNPSEPLVEAEEGSLAGETTDSLPSLLENEELLDERHNNNNDDEGTDSSYMEIPPTPHSEDTGNLGTPPPPPLV